MPHLQLDAQAKKDLMLVQDMEILLQTLARQNLFAGDEKCYLPNGIGQLKSVPGMVTRGKRPLAPSHARHTMLMLRAY